MSFHLPERVGHSRDKAPLALHIGFQIFCALPVNLPDCFLLLQLFLYCIVLNRFYNDIIPDFLRSQYINPVNHKQHQNNIHHQRPHRECI